MKKKTFKFILITLVIMASISCSKNTNSSADLILKNARVWTMNPEQPWAQALAVKNGLLLTVGENSEVLDYQNANTEIIDAQGKLVVPGFIDSHVHFITGVLSFGIGAAARCANAR